MFKSGCQFVFRVAALNSEGCGEFSVPSNKITISNHDDLKADGISDSASTTSSASKSKMKKKTNTPTPSTSTTAATTITTKTPKPLRRAYSGGEEIVILATDQDSTVSFTPGFTPTSFSMNANDDIFLSDSESDDDSIYPIGLMTPVKSDDTIPEAVKSGVKVALPPSLASVPESASKLNLFTSSEGEFNGDKGGVVKTKKKESKCGNWIWSMMMKGVDTTVFTASKRMNWLALIYALVISNSQFLVYSSMIAIHVEYASILSSIYPITLVSYILWYVEKTTLHCVLHSNHATIVSMLNSSNIYFLITHTHTHTL